MTKQEKLLLAICMIATAGCIYLGIELNGTRKLVRQMGVVINCTSAMNCYQEFMRTGDMDPGCVEIFFLIDPEECADLFDDPERLEGY